VRLSSKTGTTFASPLRFVLAYESMVVTLASLDYNNAGVLRQCVKEQPVGLES